MNALLPPAHRELKQSTDDVRTVGALFSFLGIVIAAIGLAERRRDGIGVQVLALVNTIVLLGPGVWYVVASVMMRRRLSRQAMVVSVWVALGQLVIVPGTLAIGMFSRVLGFSPGIFLVPAGTVVFFLPALIALLFVLRRVRWVMNRIAPDAHGFEAIPVRALPVAQDMPNEAGHAAKEAPPAT